MRVRHPVNPDPLCPPWSIGRWSAPWKNLTERTTSSFLRSASTVSGCCKLCIKECPLTPPDNLPTIASSVAALEDTPHNCTRPERESWTHGRGIDISVLEEDLRLKIENYTEPSTLRDCFEKYFALNIDYIRKNQAPFFLHTRRYI